ncbi:MAG: DUF362 domain-containing protein [Candidatus Sumerlaeota bacterium]|nr:DUF362 domain-containing protein [Candidatus Sumerlaeota bacterium]
MDRRDFLRTAAGLSAAMAAVRIGRPAGAPPPASAPAKRALVVRAHDPAVRVQGEQFDPARLQQMLDKALMRVTNANDAASAWKALFSPKDVVGLKVNCLAGPRMSTHPAVVDQIVRGLRLAGVPDVNIYIWEMKSPELQRAGFQLTSARTGVHCVGTDGHYDADISNSGQVGSCLAPFVSHLCTAHINVPIVKDHLVAGLGVGLKNFYGAIHNPNKYHDNTCSPYVADVNNFPQIRTRLRLVVCDALNAQYDGGPTLRPERLWEENSLLLGVDPVALDVAAMGMIDAKRAEAGLKSIAESGRAPKWLDVAAQYGLGERDLQRIDCVNV